LKKKYFRALEITAKTYINTFISGSHVSSLKDSVIDVDTIRDYQPGDKKLDVKSSLRANKIMARVFSPEKSMNLLILLDVSSSQLTKAEHTFTTALYLSYLADMAYDKVGLVVFADKILEYIEPSSDSSLVNNILEKYYDKQVESGYTGLENTLPYVSRLNLTNTYIVLISDFCYTITDNMVRVMKRIMAGINNSFISLIMLNSDEWSFEKQSFSVNFSDIESGEQVMWNLNSSNRVALVKWQKELKIRLRQGKTEPIFLHTKNDRFLMPLVKYFLRGQ
jgi:uncharacterized protein (DUF58 family)